MPYTLILVNARNEACIVSRRRFNSRGEAGNVAPFTQYANSLPKAPPRP